MKKKLIILFLALSFYCCKTSDTNTSIQKNDWVVSSLKDFSKQDSVNISIVNNRDKNIFVFDPFLKKVEKFDGEKWNRVKIPYCPCGGCANPPDSFSISPKSEHTFFWDKNLVTCKNGRIQTQKAKIGTYRVTFRYIKTQNQRVYEELVVKFEI